MIPDRKKVVTDRVYSDTKDPHHYEKLSYQNPLEIKMTAKYKSHIRCRHEMFNGRLNLFGLWVTHFTTLKRTIIFFLSVAVMIQYQKDLGAKLLSAWNIEGNTVEIN